MEKFLKRCWETWVKRNPRSVSREGSLSKCDFILSLPSLIINQKRKFSTKEFSPYFRFRFYCKYHQHLRWYKFTVHLFIKIKQNKVNDDIRIVDLERIYKGGRN